MKRTRLLGWILFTSLLATAGGLALSGAAPGSEDPKAHASPTRVSKAKRPQGKAATNDRSGTAETVELSPRLDALKQRIHRVLGMYYPRKLNSRDHDCWEIMHSIIGYGVASTIRQRDPKGPEINSVTWLCTNGSCKGERLLHMEQGRVAARKGIGVQGHHGQFLAILAQSRVKVDYPIRLDGKSFTLNDLLETEKLGCEANTELTFKLISLVHYCDLDATWENYAGERWSIPRLIREEIRQPLRGAACGGTHRLMGLSYAYVKREKRGQPIDGEFARAEKFVRDYHRYTLSLQNPDGSLSTEWFNRRGARPDLERRLQTTGHILEWMAFSLPQDWLTEQRVVRAFEYLAGILNDHPKQPWEIGHLGHALHALSLYDERVFKQPLPAPPEIVTLDEPSEAETTDEDVANPSMIEVAQEPAEAIEDASTAPGASGPEFPSPLPASTRLRLSNRPIISGPQSLPLGGSAKK